MPAIHQDRQQLPVWVDPDRLGGAPCFQGTRCPVEAMFDNLQAGLSLDEFLDCFPEVTREQAVAVLEHTKRDSRFRTEASGKLISAHDR